jgi:hypothetical protein
MKTKLAIDGRGLFDSMTLKAANIRLVTLGRSQT